MSYEYDIIFAPGTKSRIIERIKEWVKVTFDQDLNINIDMRTPTYNCKRYLDFNIGFFLEEKANYYFFSVKVKNVINEYNFAPFMSSIESFSVKQKGWQERTLIIGQMQLDVNNDLVLSGNTSEEDIIHFVKIQLKQLIDLADYFKYVVQNNHLVANSLKSLLLNGFSSSKAFLMGIYMESYLDDMNCVILRWYPIGNDDAKRLDLKMLNSLLRRYSLNVSVFKDGELRLRELG